jgi:ACT domain-containing protein
MRKTQQDWLNIFQHQKESGLTIKAFCQQNKISSSSFYKYKQLIPAQSDFIQAKIVRKTSVTEQVVQVSNAAPIITLDTSVGRLSLPKSTTPSYLIQLVRGLS